MAETRLNCHVLWVLFVSVMYGFYCVNSDGVDLPSEAQVNMWTDSISRKLLTRMDRMTGATEVKRLYKEMGFEPVYVNGSGLVLKVAEKWEYMLRDKMVAVKNIVNALETAFENYDYNTSLEEKDVFFYNAKNMTNIELTYLDNFKSEVNTNYSSVQIPTDIWDGDKTILNGIKATDVVDEVFRKNYENDPQLLWQYFGSADGFYRSYPAAKWITKDPNKDQYDVRRRGWYIQAASSPKDVMILVDRSGSTYGMTLEITKVSVGTALDTLGNDDFVNVAWFNDEAELVSCFDTFVQANLRNKNLLKQKVKELIAGGVANFRAGLKKAFDAFEEFRNKKQEMAELNQGAECHEVILIFTDGGEADEQETFEKYNREPFRTRVFVFKVGTDSMVPADGVRQMACDNKGYFSNIQSFGAVRLTTLDYVPVLSRPMVLSGKKHFQWSDIYLDVLGLGMMTTLTLPVYNKTGNNNQQMLAVVGTDITTKNMEDTVPQRKPGVNSLYNKAIGPEGYAFGINSNGYILLHPRLKAEEEIVAILESLLSHISDENLGYLSEPPNVDFLEVEYEIPEKTKLRIDMINQQTGQATMRTPIMSHDERYLEFTDMTYSYTFIANTTFSVAIAQPKFGLWEFKIPNNINLAFALGSIQEPQVNVTLLIAPWEFCESHAGSEGNISTLNITKSIQAAIDKLTGLDKVLQECDDLMVRKLLMDANITRHVAEYWKTEKTNNPDIFDGVIFQTVATNGGATRIFPARVDWSEEEIAAFKDPWEQAYFQRALYTKDYVFAAPYNSGSVSDMAIPVNETYLTPLMVSRAINMQKDIIHAVVAASLSPGEFNNFWIEETKKGFNGQTDETLSCANQDIHCYLLDDGGFIIATNQDEKQGSVGSFFGIIDGGLMFDMMNKSVYYRMTMNDFQAACPRHSPDSPASGPRTFHVPTMSDVINFNMWAATATWSFFRHFLYDMFFLGVTDLMSHNHVEALNEDPKANVSCIKILKQYYFGEVESESGEIECVDCTRLWRASHINGTNLLLVISQNECDICPQRNVTQAPKEPGPGEGPDPCVAATTPRYRKKPNEYCYDLNDNEDFTDCSSASALRLHLFSLLALQSFFVMVTRII